MQGYPTQGYSMPAEQATHFLCAGIQRPPQLADSCLHHLRPCTRWSDLLACMQTASQASRSAAQPARRICRAAASLCLTLHSSWPCFWFLAGLSRLKSDCCTTLRTGIYWVVAGLKPLLPLNGARWLRCDVIHNAIHALDRVADASGDCTEECRLKLVPVCRHAVS